MTPLLPAFDAYIVSFIITYAGEITNWKAASGSQDEYVNIGLPDNVTIAPAALGTGKFETEAFDDQDAEDNTIVYYTFSSMAGVNEVKSVVAADSVTGIVTKEMQGDGFVLAARPTSTPRLPTPTRSMSTMTPTRRLRSRSSSTATASSSTATAWAATQGCGPPGRHEPFHQLRQEHLQGQGHLPGRHRRHREDHLQG
jgi:hypothetical protein